MDEDEVITVEDSTAPDETVVIAEEDSDTDVDNSEVNVSVEPVVIVEADGDEGASDAEIDRAVETAERLTNLENQMGAMVGQLADVANAVEGLSFRQENTDAVLANEAQNLEAVEDAVAEGIAEDLELDADGDPDTPPSSAKRHWFFQSWKELRGKN